jgi:hypothetical protein
MLAADGACCSARGGMSKDMVIETTGQYWTSVQNGVANCLSY